MVSPCPPLLLSSSHRRYNNDDNIYAYRSGGGGGVFSDKYRFRTNTPRVIIPESIAFFFSFIFPQFFLSETSHAYSEPDVFRRLYYGRRNCPPPPCPQPAPFRFPRGRNAVQTDGEYIRYALRTCRLFRFRLPSTVTNTFSYTRARRATSLSGNDTSKTQF